MHGGGFYLMQKYTVAPEELPEELHWFKYEAYFTFLSGFALMGVIYYWGADSYLFDLIDNHGRDIFSLDLETFLVAPVNALSTFF